MYVKDVMPHQLNQMSNEQMMEFIIRTIIACRRNYITHLDIVLLLFYNMPWLTASNYRGLKTMYLHANNEIAVLVLAIFNILPYSNTIAACKR